MTTKEQYKLLKKIANDLCGIFDGWSDEIGEESETYQSVVDVEKNISTLLDSYEEAICAKKEPVSCKNCYILRDREDGEVIVKTYDEDQADVMMRNVSKVICFSDCDDTFEVIKIVYKGREVEYTGWQPGMVMSYEYTATGDEAWSCCVPEWDH